MSDANEIERVRNGNGIMANENHPSTPSNTSDSNRHSETKRAAAVAVDHSVPVVTSTTSTSPSNWVRFGNGDDNSDDVSSIQFAFNFNR